MFLLLIGAAGLYLVLGSLGEGLFPGAALATIGLSDPAGGAQRERPGGLA